MGFSKDVVVEAFVRANGRCEIGGEKLVFDRKGMSGLPGAWYIVPKASGNYSLGNCAVVCERCYLKIQLYRKQQQLRKQQRQKVEKPRYNSDFDRLILDRNNFPGGSSFDDLIFDRRNW